MLLFFVLSFAVENISAAEENLRYVKYKAKNGDNVKSVFQKYSLEYNEANIKRLKLLNKKKFTKNLGLMIGVDYNLPIVITELFQNDDEIISYNKNLEKRGLRYKVKKTSYYIPYEIYISKKKTSNSDSTKTKITKLKKEENIDEEEILNKKEVSEKEKKIIEKLFGKNYSKVKILDKKLKDRVFYLDPGHGGPDPGALGELSGNKISEDEYAYDITLRLGYFLMQHSAKVHFLVHDHNDGIRDEQFLKIDNDELNNDDSKISLKQKTRLEQRIKNLNELRKANKKLKPKSEDLLTIHLDSRDNDQRIDIFFYYQEENEESMNLANCLYNTIESKYEKYQPGRGYKGSVTTRELYMLKNSPINAVFMELGNIKNSSDQKRFIQKNNRQAIANWLCDGILDFYSKTTLKNTKK